MISITVDDNNTPQQLQRAADPQGWRKPMTMSLALLVDDIAEYPPPPSGSSYRRTLNLGRAWTSAQYEIHASTGGITGVIGNAVRDRRGRAYGPYVQSAEDQANVHRGRWSTDEMVAERNTNAIVRIWGAWMDEQL
jgi:hypothetical protein